jgi:hypothetical protein
MRGVAGVSPLRIIFSIMFRIMFSTILITSVCVAVVSVNPGVAFASQPKPDAAGTVWLCRPGQANDPCAASLLTTVVGPGGVHHVVDYKPVQSPPVDCFYLYPNITHQQTPDANLHVDAQETSIAELEASPFSQDCSVYAPMYRERSFVDPDDTSANRVTARSVLRAWNDYLAHFNDGRGVVLIGHSEGAYELAQILISHIDRVPRVRRLLVSAVITGQDLLVYKSGFGPLTTIGPCQSDTQTGCVVGYNAYSETPPSDSKFGRVPALLNGHPVQDICTNPANLGGGSGELISMYRTHLPTQQVAGSVVQGIFGAHIPTSSTPWIEYDGLYSARCETTDGARVLRVSAQRRAPPLSPLPDAAWGLHVDDPNLAMGNLVALVHEEAASYISAHPTASAS